MALTPDFDLPWLIDLAHAAGDIALGFYRRTVAQWKPDATLVTEADRAVEHFLSHELHRRYAADGILGEEGAGKQATSGRTWVLDPIDGTAVFAAGLPIWAVCIGLMVEERAAAGIVYLPATSDCFAAGLDGPATLNDAPIQVLPPGPLHIDSMIFGAADAHRRWQIDFPGKVRGFGSCAANICFVARGSGVGAVNTGTALWDVAAALPILERAGGRAVLLDGSPLPLAQMFDGAKLTIPLLVASPHYLDDLRSRLRFHGSPGS
jgi:myo-inositol-1(or 4)-monophosphatase